ncbi:BLOC-1-related complex subunit 8 homolog [Diorhabda sublineata]|uniref:BLOC-1-related complex subunit 8 homolog n=1 Tax=Diorhabda sublineata TaxID=1163346 RepID=UPI0024E18F2B|nr:BLOC-1-related complex subunit 8 homolog [Diorhabda sublineata]
MSFNSDSDLETKVRKSTERISENMHIVANEPSLAFYRLQEHVRKALNPMVERRVDVNKLHVELQGRCYDVEYAVGALKSMDKSEDSFKNIQDNLKNAIFLKQQLKYEESRKKKSDTNSVYKRLSAHITLDLPELPELSDVVRETASRVEHIMSKATHN